MKCFVPLLVLLLLPLCADDLARIESLTGQWMSLRLDRAREGELWSEESARLRMERSLLEQTEQRLRAELEAIREDASEGESAQAEVLEELDLRRGREESLLLFLNRSEAALRVQIDKMPPPLRDRLEKERTGMQSAGKEVLPRFRALLSLHNQLLHVQTEIFVSPMMVEIEGRRREMEVLWIGEAAAYAVSADNQVAARARQSPEGLTWESLPGTGPRIREALAVFKREKAPVLLDLPVEGAL